jgi:hypothetical protein
MAEPFATAVAGIELVDIAVSRLIELTNFIKSVRNAPAEIQSKLKSFEFLALYADALRAGFKRPEGESGDVLDKGTRVLLETAIETYDVAKGEIEGLLRQYGVRAGKKGWKGVVNSAKYVSSHKKTVLLQGLEDAEKMLKMASDGLIM